MSGATGFRLFGAEGEVSAFTDGTHQIHHSRKAKETDKGARGLLNLISGHQMLQRRARSICYLGRLSDEFEEKRVAAV